MIKRNRIAWQPDIHLFRRIEPKRPSIVRVGNVVKICHLYKGTGECLGPQCFWPKVGSCATFNRLKSRFKAR